MSIMITGTPGVGKHTICKQIINSTDLSLLDVNQIVKESGLFKRSGKTIDVDVDKLKKIIDNKMSDSKLIVGHMAPYVISPEYVKLVIVLRRSPYELLSTYKKREYDEEKIKENVGSEILGIIASDSLKKFGVKKVVQVNISKSTLEENIYRVLQNIQGNKDSDFVDWLERIKENNDLKKFFAY